MTTKPLPSADKFTPIDDIATAWGVTPKTVNNWCEFVYQGFGIMLPSNGPFPQWAVKLLELCAKHISEKASLYHAETGEKRRLKGADFVAKMRRLRAEGHFQEFEKFQNFQNFQNSEDASDDLFAEVGAIVRESDQELQQIKVAIHQHEDAQIEELAQFIEDSPQRKKGKLLSRLQTGKVLRGVQDTDPTIGTTIDVAYTKENF
ncbi:hypothetical protein H6F67_03395 [Microcoleus sp. FACHB-1515]|uniref:hypothetical protein n=1 Tax=Cyanophyceae TaxID=3028117 RepID=UPI0016888CDF|nr:hypothetical protein [Microcoleus sp. FACHB-1515]MBD2088895.1 hypothetical protein [Microcoleus sp. FACHB-1515]